MQNNSYIEIPYDQDFLEKISPFMLIITIILILYESCEPIGLNIL